MLNNTLFVGDPHVKLSNIDDSANLFNFVCEKAIELKVKKIVILGDLMDTHSVIRAEVLSLWNDVFLKLSALEIPVIVMKGNHDEVGLKAMEKTVHSLTVFKNKIKNVKIVDDFLIEGRCLYLAHTRDHDSFVKVCNEAPEEVDTLIAHQNFTEDLFGDKIDPSLMKQKFIISGHVHSTKLSTGKVFYTGTPRALGMIDANNDKGVWVLTHTSIGYSKEFIPTEGIVTSYKKFFVKEGEELPKLDSKNKNYLELEGSNAWITLMKKKIKGMENVQIKGVPTDARISSERKNIKTIYDFLDSGFKPIDGISLEDIKSYIGALQ